MVCRIEHFSAVMDMSCEAIAVGPKIIDAARPLKVVYLLHGLTGSCENWLQYTRLAHYAREADTLFILPSAGRSWYTDMKLGQKYFTYVSQELPQFCKALFNISAKREDTAIMGNSMGGYGALKCALTYPEQYGLCCAFSPAALYWSDYLKMPNCADLQHEFKGIFGTELNIEPQNEIMYLAKAHAAASLPVVRSFCGKQDFLYEMNCRFASDMQKLMPDYKHEEWAGEHDWNFWDTCLQKVLSEFNYTKT